MIEAPDIKKLPPFNGPIEIGLRALSLFAYSGERDR